MDAMTLFPALLALMVAALSGLGYALHRLANTASQFTLPPQYMQSCARCGGSLIGGLSHCPGSLRSEHTAACAWVEA